MNLFSLRLQFIRRGGRALREAILRAFAPSRATLQVDLSYATTDELMVELLNRSRALVIVQCPLIAPDDIRTKFGGAGDGARVCELIGLLDFARNSLREMTRRKS